MDLSAARIAVELLDGYLNGKGVSEACEENMIEPEEFLQKEFDQRKCGEETRDVVAELFFRILKFKRLLDVILEDFYNARAKRIQRTSEDHCLYLVLLCYALFELNEENRERMEEIMTKMNINKAFSLASFLKKSDFVYKLFARAIQIWDINYVRQSIMGSIKESTFVELYKGIHMKMIANQTKQIKEPTKPIEMQVLKRKPRSKLKMEDVKDVCETAPQIQIRPVPVPKTTYVKPTCEKKLMADREKNQEKAKRLYEVAQKYPFRVATLPKTKEVEIEDCGVETKPIRRSRIPIDREPRIQPKKTATVILREGARLMKIEQDEIKRLEDIMKGAFNSESLKVLEREIQEENIRKHMEGIEKKRLQCLLTYEEALLARQKFMQKTKEGADELRKEKEAWTKQLEEWKAEEQARIRESFEKGKAYGKGAKEAVEHIREEKHRSVQETMEESRILKEKWLAEKEEELKRKIQLIKEIKALQAFGLIRRKETVANAIASVGILCEMSTEELKERLLILKMEIKEEIERRREEIKQKKECRKAIVESYRDLIEQHQQISNYKKEKEKLEKTEKNQRTLVKSSSVEALKKKLDEKRKERMRVTMGQRT